MLSPVDKIDALRFAQWTTNIQNNLNCCIDQLKIPWVKRTKKLASRPVKTRAYPRPLPTLLEERTLWRSPNLFRLTLASVGDSKCINAKSVLFFIMNGNGLSGHSYGHEVFSHWLFSDSQVFDVWRRWKCLHGWPIPGEHFWKTLFSIILNSGLAIGV